MFKACNGLVMSQNAGHERLPNGQPPHPTLFNSPLPLRSLTDLRQRQSNNRQKSQPVCSSYPRSRGQYHMSSLPKTHDTNTSPQLGGGREEDAVRKNFLPPRAGLYPTSERGRVGREAGFGGGGGGEERQTRGWTRHMSRDEAREGLRWCVSAQPVSPSFSVTLGQLV